MNYEISRGLRDGAGIIAIYKKVSTNSIDFIYRLKYLAFTHYIFNILII